MGILVSRQCWRIVSGVESVRAKIEPATTPCIFGCDKAAEKCSLVPAPPASKIGTDTWSILSLL